MHTREIPAIYLPENEPYLGSKSLLAFDIAISRAMEIHAAIAPKTHSRQLSAIQQCGTEIIPQGVSLALSIRELLRQAYLFSAAILMRPLVERTGLIQYLLTNPEAVLAWHAGWPRKSQPAFEALFALVMPDASDEHRIHIISFMHKLVHTDPKSSLFNMFKKEDGSYAFSSGKMISNLESAELIAELADHCLRRLTSVSILIFDDQFVSVNTPPH